MSGVQYRPISLNHGCVRNQHRVKNGRQGYGTGSGERRTGEKINRTGAMGRDVAKTMNGAGDVMNNREFPGAWYCTDDSEIYTKKRSESMVNRLTGSMVGILVAANFAVAEAGVSVDVNTPNVRVQVGSPQPSPPAQMTVVERERVIVREREVVRGKKDHGRHKGHYKKHKKHHSHDD
jgi:hypothetical protein